mgnify:CR=1 FL=1
MSLFGVFQESLRQRRQTAEGQPLALYAAALRRELIAVPPERLAPRVAATLLDTTTLALSFWDEPVQARYPELIWQTASGRPLDELSQALLLHHLHHSDGTRPTGRWIAFGELPDGMFYSQAFSGYTAAVLARQFGDALEAFSRCAMQVPGCQGEGATVAAPMAWVFRVLPLVPLAVAAWPGDEDVPTSYRLLFDAAVPHHLSTEGCALLGSMLTRRLVRARSAVTT